MQGAVLEKFHVFLTVGVYAVDPVRRADREKIAETACRHPGVLGVHGIFFDDAARTGSFDVVVDFTVRDRPALRDALLAELAPLFPGHKFAINFDTNYSD